MDEPFREIPYCGAAPGPDVWLQRWNLDPLLGTALLLLAAALWRAQAQPAAASGRLRSLRLAWTLTALLYVSPLCALSSAFFTIRVVHHMALVLAVAPLLAFGLAPWLRRLPTPLWTCTAIATLAFWVWHAPAAYTAALTSHALYALMQLSLLATATLFWLAVRRAGAAAAIGAILATMVLTGLLGALISFAARPLYAPHFASALDWGVSALQDQQLAGLTMWAPGSMAYLGVALCIAWRCMRAAPLGTEPA